MLQEGFTDYAASRAYYSVFYALTALFLKRGMTFRKHSGLISALHKDFIRTGIFDHDIGKGVSWLFELRSLGDYGIDLSITFDEADKAISFARDFSALIENYLQEVDSS